MTDVSSVSHAPRSPWREAWRRLRRNRLAVACGTLLVLIGLVLQAQAVGRTKRDEPDPAPVM